MHVMLPQIMYVPCIFQSETPGGARSLQSHTDLSEPGWLFVALHQSKRIQTIGCFITQVKKIKVVSRIKEFNPC